ncbi:hypothetical protein PMIN06_008472 [Paraphaeosphaeria minitans]|uniref:Uncharacterized protein n=1 Tax=Paraphaeosphaeria minitans TaxID=565426 RepID=A0A9P6GRV8_9PLEO|nr:hypothetical protein PMIN01_03049 [Paraphaeosphaeria minitans]
MSLSTQFLRATVRSVSRAPLRRGYATGHDERTQQTLKTSSRLTWLTTSAAALAAGAYYYANSSSPDSPTTVHKISEKIDHTKHSDLEAPKSVEDRHGDTVAKHAMAAHKNEYKVREGVFSGKEFDNHLQKHSTDPSRDFEVK